MDELDEHELATLQAIAAVGGTLRPENVTDPQTMSDLARHGCVWYRWSVEAWVITDAGWAALNDTAGAG